MINTQELQGQWNQLRGRVKEKWGQLTDDDLQITGGNIDQLIGRIQTKTGVKREEIETFLNDLTAHGSSMVSHATEAVGQFAKQATETVGQYSRQATDRFRQGYDQIADEYQQRYDQAERIVRENPAQALAWSFGFGVLLGVVVGISLRSR